MKSILFVCTGNIFRSMIAEYALKAALNNHGNYRVSSAGIEARPQQMAGPVRAQLLARGIDPSAHRQRKLTQEMLAEADLVVAMGFDHREFIKQNFNRDVLLFNQICFDKEEPVLDTWEAIPNWQDNLTARDAHIQWVVDHICEAMPVFIKKVEHLLADDL